MSIVSKQQAKELLAEATNCQAEIIPEHARIGQFESWDSLAHLRLILAIEQYIGRQLDPDESVKIESLADISAILPARR
jgi:acyl carrier protein